MIVAKLRAPTNAVLAVIVIGDYFSMKCATRKQGISYIA